MFALLNVNKPSGITSRDVVNRVSRLIRPVKVGHAGTLDPLASGVLVLCLGRATRLIQYVQQMPKHYVGKFLLGQQSDTEDTEGIVHHLDSPHQPTLAEIQQQLPAFSGEILQQPPIYSALKVNGRRAYDLARRGEPVELQPRKINIYEMKILEYQYPEITLDIKCGSGTYIRSIGRDIARSVGTEAVMAGLVRHAIGEFQIDKAMPCDRLSIETINHHLIPPIDAMTALPTITLTDDELKRIENGLTIQCDPSKHPTNQGLRNSDNQETNEVELTQEYTAIDHQGRLRSILKKKTSQTFTPKKNFPLQ